MKMSIKVSGIDRTMRDIRNKLRTEKQRKLVEVTNKILVDLEEETPKKTGLASQSWEAEIVGDKAVITNEQPYIDDLNRGSSAQAPAHFIEKTILSNKDVVPNGTIVSYR